jgi:DNA processing protein
VRPEDLRAVLELRLRPGIGDLRLRRLLRRHGTPREALAAFREDPDRALGWTEVDPPPGGEGAEGRPRARFPRQPAESRRTQFIRDQRIERSVAAIHALGIHVVLERQPKYPARLRQLYAPPPVLFARGNPGLWHMPGVAIVGSRVHTEYGASVTRLVADTLARQGVVVISGLARGIDSIAHEAALAAGGRTIAVLGCGPDVVYPRENETLQRHIAEKGLLVSELPPGEPALAHHFPKRNRLLAALSHAAVVVEAGSRSGALITARDAIDLGREVFAVPGPIGRPTSEGTNELIQALNAHLLTSPAQILEKLMEEHPPPRIPPLAARAADVAAAWPGRQGGEAPAASHHTVLSNLGPESAQVDEVAARSGLSATAALVALLELELEGRVRRLPGMRFARSAGA